MVNKKNNNLKIIIGILVILLLSQDQVPVSSIVGEEEVVVGVLGVIPETPIEDEDEDEVAPSPATDCTDVGGYCKLTNCNRNELPIFPRPSQCGALMHCCVPRDMPDCHDYDDGIDREIASYCRDPDGTYYDFCNNGAELREYYCDEELDRCAVSNERCYLDGTQCIQTLDICMVAETCEDWCGYRNKPISSCEVDTEQPRCLIDRAGMADAWCLENELLHYCCCE